MLLREIPFCSDALLKAHPRHARQRHSGAQISSRLFVRGGLHDCLQVRAACQTQIRRLDWMFNEFTGEDIAYTEVRSFYFIYLLPYCL